MGDAAGGAVQLCGDGRTRSRHPGSLITTVKADVRATSRARGEGCWQTCTGQAALGPSHETKVELQQSAPPERSSAIAAGAKAPSNPRASIANIARLSMPNIRPSSASRICDWMLPYDRKFRPAQRFYANRLIRSLFHPLR